MDPREACAQRGVGYVEQVTLSSAPHLSGPAGRHPSPLYFDLFDVKLAFTPGGPWPLNNCRDRSQQPVEKIKIKEPTEHLLTLIPSIS